MYLVIYKNLDIILHNILYFLIFLHAMHKDTGTSLQTLLSFSDSLLLLNLYLTNVRQHFGCASKVLEFLFLFLIKIIRNDVYRSIYIRIYCNIFTISSLKHTVHGFLNISTILKDLNRNL